MVRYNKTPIQGGNENNNPFVNQGSREVINLEHRVQSPVTPREDKQPDVKTKQPQEVHAVEPKVQEDSLVDDLMAFQNNGGTEENVKPKKEVKTRAGKGKPKARKGSNPETADLTPEELEAIEKHKAKLKKLKKYGLITLTAILVVAMGVFSFFYFIKPPLKEVNEKQTSGYKLSEWNAMVNVGKFTDILVGGGQPYMGLEFSYAADDENMTNFLKEVYGTVKYESIQVPAKTIWGKQAENANKQPLFRVGDVDPTKEYKLTFIDWNKINFTESEIAKAKETLGVDNLKSLTPEEDNKIIFSTIMANKLSDKVSEEVESKEKAEGTEKKSEKEGKKESEETKEEKTSDKEVKTTDKDSKEESDSKESKEEEESIGGVDLPESVDISKSENGNIPLTTIMHTPQLTQEDGVWKVAQEEDIFLNTALFNSKDFNKMIYRFQKALAGDGEIVTKAWTEWNNLPKLQKEAQKEPEKFDKRFSMPDAWICAYKMQNPNGGNKSAIKPKVGTGSKDDPASLETPVKTVKRVAVDGGTQDKNIQVNLKSFKEGKEALDWFESKDVRNRGLTTASRMKYYGYELEVTNLSDSKLVIEDNTDLVDENINSLGRTGTMYGMKDKVELEPGQKGVIETWGMTTSPQRAYLIWGKDFNRQIDPVWFRVLAGGDNQNNSSDKTFEEGTNEKK